MAAERSIVRDTCGEVKWSGGWYARVVVTRGNGNGRLTSRPKRSLGFSFVPLMTFSEKAVTELLKSGELGELLDQVFSREKMKTFDDFDEFDFSFIRD